MSEKSQIIASLYDGIRSAKEIGLISGLSPRYCRKVAKMMNLPRLHVGAQPGANNHQFVSGRRIDPDGYVLVTAPSDHPYARNRVHRAGKLIYEHRLILEKKIGRYMLPEEVVDHIDGLTLHNEPSNLRLFDQNGEHLKATITGLPKQISVSGRQNIKARFHLPVDFQCVDTYGRRRKRGEIRLRQILLAALRFGIDSPFLWGTHFHLDKAQIDYSSRSTIELALADLYLRWESDLAL